MILLFNFSRYTTILKPLLSFVQQENTVACYYSSRRLLVCLSLATNFSGSILVAFSSKALIR